MRSEPLVYSKNKPTFNTSTSCRARTSPLSAGPGSNRTWFQRCYTRCGVRPHPSHTLTMSSVFRVGTFADNACVRVCVAFLFSSFFAFVFHYIVHQFISNIPNLRRHQLRIRCTLTPCVASASACAVLVLSSVPSSQQRPSSSQPHTPDRRVICRTARHPAALGWCRCRHLEQVVSTSSHPPYRQLLF